VGLGIGLSPIFKWLGASAEEVPFFFEVTMYAKSCTISDL